MLIERFSEQTAPESFDLVYSFAVLEHVADLDDVIGRILRLLNPGGRFCFVVPMNELTAVAPLPPFVARHGMLGHVRCFSEASLRSSFGDYRDFELVKLPSPWRPERYPAGIVPVEFGAFFVAFSKGT
jgi:SAM-dependent methyltransferase